MSAQDYRAHVGDPSEFDRRGAVQFCVMTMMGLREHHYLLDIGCGSLRGGRLFIPYLLRGHYFGVEREDWIVKQGIKNQLGNTILMVKNPTFSYRDVGAEDLVLDLREGGFDYVLAQALFCHLTLAEIRRCIEQASLVLKAHGQFVASFHEGETDDPRTELTYPEVALYTIESIRRWAHDAHLSCSEINPTLLGGTALDSQYRRMTWVVMERI